jgi:hypothetical protein
MEGKRNGDTGSRTELCDEFVSRTAQPLTGIIFSAWPYVLSTAMKLWRS